MARVLMALKLGLGLMLLLIVTACKTFWSDDSDEDDGPFKGKSAQVIFKEANAALAKKDYTTAVKDYEGLETLYPFNDFAETAGMKLIYAYYKKEDYASAAASAERFIHLYPRAAHVDYAYYMKALANSHQPRGAITVMIPVDESWRDPGTESLAYSDFSTFVQKFPNSRYKNNALQHLIHLRNMFAQTEYNVANYYYERRMYVAAIERAGYLVKTYPEAPSVKPALALIYYANKSLGLMSAAADARQVYLDTYHREPELSYNPDLSIN
ncbi:MAG: outer membrane protein assembly factor BamD [Legionella sp. 21-45-4]|nr:MAG: outer membrane protein assembly factor BamD [Legionella sp. 21-45-4]